MFLLAKWKRTFSCQLSWVLGCEACELHVPQLAVPADRCRHAPSPSLQVPTPSLAPRLVTTVQLQAEGFSSLCGQGINPTEELNIHPFDQLAKSDHAVASSSADPKGEVRSPWQETLQHECLQAGNKPDIP